MPAGPGADAGDAAREDEPGSPSPRSPLEGPRWLLGGLLLATAATWPLVRSLGTVVPQDAGDPVAQAWQVAWGGHALTAQPGRLFEANGFFPATPSLAFSDSLLGYAPFALVGQGTTAALVRYGLLFVFAYALCFAGAGLLGRELGLRVPAAIVVGVAYAWAPWRMAQNGHLNILSTGGVALAVFLLLTGYRRGRAWQVALGWVAAAWQLSLGFALGIWFAYLLAVLAAVAGVGWLLHRPVVTRSVMVASGAGGGLLLATAGLLARPYLDVVARNPDAARGLAEVEFYSPPLRSLLVADGTNRLWGEATRTLRETLPWAPEQALFPGVAVVVLAVLGLRWRGASRQLRTGLGVGLALVVLLSFGLTLLDGLLYRPLFDHLPGWDGLRTPGRLAFVWTLLLALLAGMGAQRIVDAVSRVPGSTAPGSLSRALGAAVALGLAAVVLLEGLPRLPLATPPAPPAALAGTTDPLVHLPSGPGPDSTYLWWSTDGFPRIGNGNGSYVPPELASLREQTAGFPDAASVALLRARGYRTVLVHRSLVPGTAWASAPDRSVAGLGITRQDVGDVVVFGLAG